MTNETEQIAVRLPVGMRDRLKEVAKAANRSVNAQVITILEIALANTTDAATQK